MKNSLQLKVLSLVALFLIGLTTLNAQDITTVEAVSNDISNNLDLQAVASIFGDAKDLADFEKSLNDPEARISNLDLNEDGYVDYLRIVELTEERTHLILIQAVLGEDQFQDVATIEVEKDKSGQTHVQVVGDVFMYGEDFIIEPIYVHRPVFFRTFWRPYYHPYHSAFYWGFYPHHFHYWRPFHTHVYVHHVHSFVNVHHTFHFVHHRRSHVAYTLHTQHRRTDFSRRNPHRSFAKRTGFTRRTNINRRGIALRTSDTSRRGQTVNRRGTTSRLNKSDRRNETVNRRGTSNRLNKDKKVRQVSKRDTRNTTDIHSKRGVKVTDRSRTKQNTQLQRDRGVTSKPQRGVSQRKTSTKDRKPVVRSRNNSPRKSISKSSDKRSYKKQESVKRSKPIQKQNRSYKQRPTKRSSDNSFKRNSNSNKSSNKSASQSTRSSSKGATQSSRGSQTSKSRGTNSSSRNSSRGTTRGSTGRR